MHLHDEDVADLLQVASIELGAYFSQVSSGSHVSPQFTALKTTRECTSITFTYSSAPYNVSFSPSELTSALRFCYNPCEGPDGVHNLMLKHLLPLACPYAL